MLVTQGNPFLFQRLSSLELPVLSTDYTSPAQGNRNTEGICQSPSQGERFVVLLSRLAQIPECRQDISQQPSAGHPGVVQETIGAVLWGRVESEALLEVLAGCEKVSLKA